MDFLMKVDTDIELSDVILSNKNRNIIDDFLHERANYKKLSKYNLVPINTLLFYGASGCGKTFLGKALSNALGYKMLYIDIARTFSTGNVALNLGNIFKEANNLKNCLIFLDEADSIAWSREADDAENGDIRRATNSLFQLIDQMDESNIVVTATNMLHKLDPAFARRFELKLQFKRPVVDVKETIGKFLYKDFEIKEDIRDEGVELTAKERISFAELEKLTNRLMKKAVLKNTFTILMSDVYVELGRVLNIKTQFGTDSDDFYN